MQRLSYPSPEELIIEQEMLREMVEEAGNKISLLISLTFHRKEIFDAWYAKNIQSSTITAIAETQKISRYNAKKRVDTAQEIVVSLRRKLHKIDD